MVGMQPLTSTATAFSLHHSQAPGYIHPKGVSHLNTIGLLYSYSKETCHLVYINKKVKTCLQTTASYQLVFSSMVGMQPLASAFFLHHSQAPAYVHQNGYPP